jgi:hypothetical protein
LLPVVRSNSGPKSRNAAENPPEMNTLTSVTSAALARVAKSATLAKTVKTLKATEFDVMENLLRATTALVRFSGL